MRKLSYEGPENFPDTLTVYAIALKFAMTRGLTIFDMQMGCLTDKLIGYSLNGVNTVGTVEAHDVCAKLFNSGNGNFRSRAIVGFITGGLRPNVISNSLGHFHKGIRGYAFIGITVKDVAFTVSIYDNHASVVNGFQMLFFGQVGDCVVGG